MTSQQSWIVPMASSQRLVGVGGWGQRTRHGTNTLAISSPVPDVRVLRTCGVLLTSATGVILQGQTNT